MGLELIKARDTDIEVVDAEENDIELYYNDEDAFRIQVGLSSKREYTQIELIQLSKDILELIKQS